MPVDNSAVAIAQAATALANQPASVVPGFTTPALTGSAVASPGRIPLARVGHEAFRLDFGKEYLFHWLNNIRSGTATTVAIIGDSNGLYVGAALATLLAQVTGVTVTNYSISGTTIGQWRQGTGAFAASGKAMSDVIAAAPHLIINLFGGTNDPYYGGTDATYLADLNAALTSLRASANGAIRRLSIVNVANATQSDGTTNAGTSDKRDEYFNAKVRIGIVAAAEAYGCGFFDRAGRYPDSTVSMLAGSTGVDTWIDSARVHTVNAHTDMLAYDLYEWLVPATYRTVGTRTNVTPSSGFSLPNNSENLAAVRTLNTVAVEGYLTGPATTLASGRSIATLSAGLRPRIDQWNVTALIYDGTLPMETNIAHIAPSGAITMEQASTKSCYRIYVRASFSVV